MYAWNYVWTLHTGTTGEIRMEKCEDTIHTGTTVELRMEKCVNTIYSKLSHKWEVCVLNTATC